MNTKRTITILVAILFALVIMTGVTMAADASGGGNVIAIFNGHVLDGPGGTGTVGDVHLSCNDGTSITVRSSMDGWYTIIIDDNPAAWCSLWATAIDGSGLQSGFFGMSKSGWNRQDLPLIWYFSFSPTKENLQ